MLPRDGKSSPEPDLTCPEIEQPCHWCRILGRGFGSNVDLLGTQFQEQYFPKSRLACVRSAVSCAERSHDLGVVEQVVRTLRFRVKSLQGSLVSGPPPRLTTPFFRRPFPRLGPPPCESSPGRAHSSRRRRWSPAKGAGGHAHNI